MNGPPTMYLGVPVVRVRFLPPVPEKSGFGVLDDVGLPRGVEREARLRGLLGVRDVFEDPGRRVAPRVADRRRAVAE